LSYSWIAGIERSRWCWITSASPPVAIRFAVFADAHYAYEAAGSRHCPYSLPRLHAAIGAWNAAELSLTVNLGDLIGAGQNRQEEWDFLAAMAQALSGLHGDKTAVLGNHDLTSFSKHGFLEAIRQAGCNLEVSAPYGSLDHQSVHLVFLDGNCHADGTDFCCGDFDWAETWVSEAQIAWLAEDLRAAGDRPAIVFCHEDLDPRLEGGAPEPHVVRNAAAVRAVLEQAGNVRAVFQGHYHPGLCAIANGIPYMGITAMVEGSRPESNAYAIVTLYADGRLEIEGFGRQHSWSFPPVLAPTRD
jgi:3',5'-cyclic AMP phosphodiesterase CpdA